MDLTSVGEELITPGNVVQTATGPEPKDHYSGLKEGLQMARAKVSNQNKRCLQTISCQYGKKSISFDFARTTETERVKKKECCKQWPVADPAKESDRLGALQIIKRGQKMSGLKWKKALGLNTLVPTMLKHLPRHVVVDSTEAIASSIVDNRKYQG